VSFGGQSVGFVSVSQSGEPGFLGQRAEVRSLTVVSGCRFRPASTSEVDRESDVASEVWKLTAPPEVAVLAADSTGELVYDGTSSPSLPDDVNDPSVFRIDGPILSKFDMDGSVEHVTVLAKRQRG
jgi:hypothetical protein